eukprot:jgi/Ulvmu1/4140/UM019_0119.1
MHCTEGTYLQVDSTRHFEHFSIVMVRAIRFAVLDTVGRSRRLSMNAAGLAQQESITVCNVYVSEGRDLDIVSALKRVPGRFPGVRLAFSFIDEPYNRSSLTLLGRGAQLSECVAALAKEAASRISLRDHVASHPRLGVVDHVACHHLGQPHQAASARSTALRVAASISEALPTLPIILYGDASPEQQQLRDVRRACGYFRGSAEGRWHGLRGISVACTPQHGPAEVHAALGICTVGSCPLIINFNILVHNLPMATARRVAKQVGERGGGLPGVEAAALPHGHGVEVACNLLQPHVSGPDAVLRLCSSLVAAEGGTVASSYRIGLHEERLQSMIAKMDG